MLQNAARGTARHIAIAKDDYIARNARVPHIVPKAYRAPQGHIPAVPTARSAIHDRRSIHACLHAIHDGEAVNSFVLFVPTFFVGDGDLDVPPQSVARASPVREANLFFLAFLQEKNFGKRRLGVGEGRRFCKAGRAISAFFSACEAAVFLNKNGGRRFVNSAILGARGLFRLQTRVPFGIIFTRGRANRP